MAVSRQDSDFDAWLTATLAADSGRVARRIIPTPAYKGGRRNWGWALVPAVLGTKFLAGATVIALAGAALGTKAAVTGSADPLQWAPAPAVPALSCALAHTCGATGDSQPAASAQPSHPAHPALPTPAQTHRHLTLPGLDHSEGDDDHGEHGGSGHSPSPEPSATGDD